MQCSHGGGRTQGVPAGPPGCGCGEAVGTWLSQGEDWVLLCVPSAVGWQDNGAVSLAFSGVGGVNRTPRGCWRGCGAQPQTQLCAGGDTQRPGEAQSGSHGLLAFPLQAPVSQGTHCLLGPWPVLLSLAWLSILGLCPPLSAQGALAAPVLGVGGPNSVPHPMVTGPSCSPTRARPAAL